MSGSLFLDSEVFETATIWSLEAPNFAIPVLDFLSLRTMVLGCIGENDTAEETQDDRVRRFCFRARLTRSSPLNRALVLPAGRIDGDWLAGALAPLYSANRRPVIESRLTIGLLFHRDIRWLNRSACAGESLDQSKIRRGGGYPRRGDTHFGSAVCPSFELLRGVTFLIDETEPRREGKLSPAHR